MSIFRRKSVEIELTNALGFSGERITLAPGKTVTIDASMDVNVCDRGFPSEDGVHRLELRTFTIPVRIRLAEQS